MTVELLMKNEIYEPSPDEKVYLELFYDAYESRLHFKTRYGHIDGFYLLSIERDRDDNVNHLKLWTSVKHLMRDISLVEPKRHLEVIGVDEV
jgi:hypothetical protein